MPSSHTIIIMASAHAALWCVWMPLLLCLHMCSADVVPRQRIRDYSIVAVPRGGTDPVPPWAVFDRTIRRDGTRSAASDYDDNSVFDPIENFTMPYYQLEDASWYIGSNGFVSPLAPAMCSQFCSGLSGRDWTAGYYKLYPSIPNGGGDWPSVQLYTYDLDPTNPGSGAIYKRVYDKVYAGSTEAIRVAVVEYFTIRPYSTSGTIPQNLTGQVELWPNGTIVLRYASTFDWQAMVVSAYDLYPPTVGLAWTKLQRYFAYQYTRSSPSAYPMALRLDPVLDECNAFTSCSSCVAAVLNVSSPVSGGCTWCGPQQLCVTSGIAADYCTASQQNECALPEVSSALFYKLLQYDQRIGATVVGNTTPRYDFLGPNMSAADLLRYLNVSWTAGAENGSKPPFNIGLPFPLPVFYNPPAFNRSDPLVRSNVFLSYYGTLSFLSPGVACEYLSYCQDGAYNYDLLGVSTYNVLLNGVTNFSYGQLPARGIHEPLCGVDGATVPLATPGGGGVTMQCPAAIFIRVERLLKYWHGSFSPATAPQRWSYTLLVDALGRMAVRYAPDNPAAVAAPNASAPLLQPSPLASYPPPHMGLFRNGSSDGSSINVPWSSVTDSTTLVFLPQPTCASCGGGGRCNRTSRLCVCLIGFTGPSCTECEAGYYGPLCAPCRNCGTHGRCNDGRSGSGSCTCAIPYSGANCSIECKAPPYTCNGCNDVGGYCECGQCICDAARGWRGANCSVWEDPCYALSLDGCPVCTAHVPVRCRYCPSGGVCFADPSQSGIGTDGLSFHTCSPSLTVNDTDCVPQPRGQPLTGILAVIVVVMTFGLLGGLVCVFLLAICICRKRRDNLLAARAITGTPNFHFVVRDREVVQMVRLQKQGRRGLPVQGIPLRQMPMKELLAFQQSRRMQKDQRNVRDWAMLREDDV